MRSPSAHLLGAALTTSSASAEVRFNCTDGESNFNGIVPAGSLLEDCTAAYAKSLTVLPPPSRLRGNSSGPALFTEGSLKELCTPEFVDSLDDWDKELNKVCTDDDIKSLEEAGGAGQYLALAPENSRSIQKEPLLGLLSSGRVSYLAPGVC